MLCWDMEQRHTTLAKVDVMVGCTVVVVAAAVVVAVVPTALVDTKAMMIQMTRILALILLRLQEDNEEGSYMHPVEVAC